MTESFVQNTNVNHSKLIDELIVVLNDESKSAWERTSAGRKIMARVQAKIAQIDKEARDKHATFLAMRAAEDAAAGVL